ncbi:hypothetical protein PG985_011677 [Apiospora marii]|uniref:uncharacterized protein n=1 Tax=Apiospora marii TaxID=335849 RepID=UPI0031326969
MENKKPGGGGQNDGGNKRSSLGGPKPSDPTQLPAAMSSITIDGLKKPTSDESQYYFAGLGGGKLIVRTNSQTRPWQGCPTEDGWNGRKHPIAKRYVALEVRENAVYEHGASTGLSAHKNIPTLESIVQDNSYWMNAADDQRDQRDARLASEETLHLLSTLGWEVAPTKSTKQTEYGTAGPFFSLEGSDELFASTCYHVLLPELEKPKSIKAGKAGPQVSQACPWRVTRALSYMQTVLKRYEGSPTIMGAVEEVKRYDEWLKSRSGPQPQEPLQPERARANVYKYMSSIHTALDTIYDDKPPGKDNEIIRGSGLKKRLIGNVYAAPEYEVVGTNGVISDPKSRGFLNDWALVKLNKEKFKKASNKMYLGKEGLDTFRQDGLDSAPELTETQHDALEREINSNNGFVRMNGQIANIQPDIPKQGKSGIPCIRVFKRGASTNLSFGVTNSIEACCDRGTGPPRNIFSTGGDSGAAVLDQYGNFIGQLVSGGPSGPSTDFYKPNNERTWRGQVEGSGDPGEPTIHESGKLPHEVVPEREPETLKAAMDVSFVHMSGPMMTDIQRWVGSKPSLFKS